jgi:hypothetical protein
LSLHGTAQLDLVVPSIDSIAQRQNFAAYHYHEYISLHEQLLQRLTLTLIIREDEDYALVDKMAANILACLQNMHAIHDTLGHVIYYALKLKIGDGFYLSHVQNAVSTPCPDLYQLLDTLTKHEDYTYLNSLMNRSKHTAIVLPYCRKSFVNGFSSVILPMFEYRKKLYSEKNAKDFLNSLYSRESYLIVKIGQEINKLLRIEVENEDSLN